MDSWTRIGKFMMKNGGKGPGKKPNAQKVLSDPTTYTPEYMKMFDAEFVSSVDGRVDYGSTNEEGLKLYMETLGKIKDKRVEMQKSGDLDRNEAILLKDIQAYHEITCADPDEEKRNKKRRRDGKPVAPARASLLLNQLSDVDSDEEFGDSSDEDSVE